MDDEECWVRRRLRMCCIVCNNSLFVAQITNVLLNVFFHSGLVPKRSSQMAQDDDEAGGQSD